MFVCPHMVATCIATNVLTKQPGFWLPGNSGQIPVVAMKWMVMHDIVHARFFQKNPQIVGMVWSWTGHGHSTINPSIAMDFPTHSYDLLVLMKIICAGRAFARIVTWDWILKVMLMEDTCKHIHACSVRSCDFWEAIYCKCEGIMDC